MTASAIWRALQEPSGRYQSTSELLMPRARRMNRAASMSPPISPAAWASVTSAASRSWNRRRSSSACRSTAVFPRTRMRSETSGRYCSSVSTVLRTTYSSRTDAVPSWAPGSSRIAVSPPTARRRAWPSNASLLATWWYSDDLEMLAARAMCSIRVASYPRVEKTPTATSVRDSTSYAGRTARGIRGTGLIYQNVDYLYSLVLGHNICQAMVMDRDFDEVDISTNAFWELSAEERDARLAILREIRPVSWQRPAA